MFPLAASPRRGEPREHLVSGRVGDVPGDVRRLLKNYDDDQTHFAHELRCDRGNDFQRRDRADELRVDARAALLTQEDRENSRGIRAVAQRDSDVMGATEQKKGDAYDASTRLSNKHLLG
jgi:hypothetical protein